MDSTLTWIRSPSPGNPQRQNKCVLLPPPPSEFLTFPLGPFPKLLVPQWVDVTADVIYRWRFLFLQKENEHLLKMFCVSDAFPYN